MWAYPFLFLLSLGLSLAITPAVRWLALNMGAIDVPSPRKVHGSPVPRLGGVAILITFLIGILASHLAYPEAALLRQPQLLGILLGSVAVAGLGIYDDLKGASALLKIVVPGLAGLLAISLGVKFSLVTNPLAEVVLDYFDLGILSVPLTLCWIVGLTNAMNFIDGLDGLAAGLTLFASTALFLISLNQDTVLVSYPYVILVGASLGFLKYNRYPARIFLGDSGSLFLGFLLACLSAMGTQKSFTLSALFIPFIVFGIPIFDVIVTFTRRRLAGMRFSAADRQHLHHQLLRLGFTQRQVVYLLYGVTIVLGILAFAFTFVLDRYAAVIVIIIGVLGGVLGRELNLIGHRHRGDWRTKGEV